MHAIVIGGSIAGLLAARVLSERCSRVTVLDRDVLPACGMNRRGVPQGWHGHGLLASGLQVLKDLFPGIEDELLMRGATSGDVARDAIWYQHGCYKARVDVGLRAVLLSRALLEGVIRQRVTELPAVHLIDRTHVVGLVMDPSRTRVTGIRVQREERVGIECLDADLVVDASGRASRAPDWLGALGFGRPSVEEVKVGLGYTTRMYERKPEHLGGAVAAIIAPTPPRQTRAGFILAQEGGRWVVSLCGWTGDHAPPTASGFLEFARSLPRPDIYDVVRSATPLTDPVAFAYPANIRHRYERMPRFPECFVVMGDAIASFNPIYGQGMSCSALEAVELLRVLREPNPLTRIGPRFFARVAKVVDIPWTMAVGADFAFKGVTGPRPRGTALVNRYIDGVHDAAATDRTVCQAFFNVANLLAPPSVLFRPGIAARVARARLFPRHTASARSGDFRPASPSSAAT